MKLKLFKKFFLTTSLIIILSLAFLMMILSFVLNNYIVGTKRDTMDEACYEVIEHINSSSEKGFTNLKEFCGVLNTVAKVSDTDIFIADEKGRVVVCGCEEWKQDGNCTHSSQNIEMEIFKQKNNEDTFRLSDAGIYQRPHYISFHKIENYNKESSAVIFAVAPTSIVKRLLSAMTKLYVISAIIPILLMFLSIYVMTYRLTKPLKLMSEASRAMAKGDFSKRIPVTTDDEIGELAASFNMMTNSLSRLEGMRKSFVADVSHELKTPMTTIGGFIDGILDGIIEPEKQKYYLNIVSDEVKRLSRLVQSMLSMAKLESDEFVLRPELFDLRELLCSVVISQEQRIVENKIQITGLEELGSVSLKADRDLIYQAVYNLVDNAIKFTDSGGEISFGLQTQNKKTILSLRNSGKGIPAKDLPYIFERFYKVDKSRSNVKNSTGLGLYIVKTIITAHRGQVNVTSKENEFTEFKIILPS